MRFIFLTFKPMLYENFISAFAHFLSDYDIRNIECIRVMHTFVEQYLLHSWLFAELSLRDQNSVRRIKHIQSSTQKLQKSMECIW